MIVIKLAGGLGNQMFQYALGRHMSLINKTDLFFDLSFFSSKHNYAECDTRRFTLDNFRISGKEATGKQVRQLSTSRYLKRLGIYKKSHIIDNAGVFNQAILKLLGNYYVEGYWSSEKYISDIRSIILSDFSLKVDLSLGVDLMDWMSDGIIVSLHCRRGDYVSSTKVNQVYNVCSLDYYQKAVNYLADKLGRYKILVFSDDIVWAKENLKFGQETKFATDYKLADYQELILMSRCQHNITANSTFSWWSAWLNDNPKKIVIVPEKWFNDPKLMENDLVPAQWIRM
ncbi:MAG: alpha-1,2-fucosyltransferase [Candidatus Falkowbacteria bacterium]